jgi:plastocyanin
MKKLVLFSVFALVYGMAHSHTVTIINSGFTFSPAEVTIDIGDTVIFQLQEMHNAVEVDETTWNGNGNTPLDGGFALGFGGGMVTGLSTGVHFYVCAPHASGGMKGKITVNASSGISQKESFENHFKLYPNPAKDHIVLEINRLMLPSGKITASPSTLAIYNASGEQVYVEENYNKLKTNIIDLSGLSAGSYVLRISSEGRIYSRAFIKE